VHRGGRRVALLRHVRCTHACSTWVWRVVPATMCAVATAVSAVGAVLAA
jgi:hypothetical protein